MSLKVAPSVEALSEDLAILVESLSWCTEKIKDLIKSGDIDGRRSALDRLKIAERAIEDCRDELLLT